MPPAPTADALLCSSLIAGDWLPAAGDCASTNPAHPGEEVGRFDAASEAEVDRAIDAANEALADWRRRGALERGAIVRRAAELLAARAEPTARLLTREEGKTLPEARAEIVRTVETLHFHAAQAWVPVGETFASPDPNEQIQTVRAPVGPVAVITPWNFPVLIPAWKIAPALVWGCTVVWKPASHTAVIASEFARLLVDAGVPAGVLNLVLGPGRVGAQLVESPGIRAVTFTGSESVGRGIARVGAERGVRVQLELGGHNAAIVFPDADLGVAARAIVSGAMLSAGQKCTATRRVIALAEIREPLIERLSAEIRALRVGDGLVDGVDVSPLISADAAGEVEREIQQARADGAEVLAGGDVLDGPSWNGGHFVAPTLLAVSDPAIRICREEVFGPVCAMLAVGDDDEAFRLANATRFGLSAAVFTTSARRARRALDQLDAGLLHVNRATTGSELHAPFGGVKASSGQSPREQGQTARDFFTETKTAYVVAVS
jgi:acyl-CoA reductase-like NAD-dependent aldehyde dehydrogenase